jgi:putative ABC transport system permease protein
MAPSDPAAPAAGQSKDSSGPTRWFAGLAFDFRHAFRQLRKHRGFTAVSLLTLALCIGANTAIFSTVYALMLKPLPFAEPDRLVEVYNTYIKAGLPKASSNVVQYLEYQRDVPAFSDLGLWTTYEAMVGEDADTQRLAGARTTADFFAVLGLKPLIGQFFTPENHLPSADKVVVLAQSYWESRYQSDPGVVGQKIRLDGESFTITGIAPRALESFNARVRFVRPISWNPDSVNQIARHGNNPQLFARLNPGTSAALAEEQVNTVERRFYETAPAATKEFIDRAGHHSAVRGVQFERVQPVRSTLLLLQGGVLFVLLIGCVNVANLLLARANARQSELAIRLALGSGRAAIGRQLLVESLLLTGLGTGLGLAVAWGAVAAFNRYRAQQLPDTLPFALDGQVLAFTAVLAVAAALLIGLAPIVHVLRADLMGLIHRSSRSASGSRGVRTLSSVLIVGQVAVALMLLTGAGLLIHSFLKATAINPGFEPQGVFAGRIAVPLAQRPNADAMRTFRDRLTQSMQEIAGVDAVALSAATPFRGNLPLNAFTLAEDTLPPGAPQPGANRVIVSPEYLKTLRLTLVEGRFLEAGDAAPGARQAFVVDENFAQKYFPGKSALGGRFTFGGRPQNEADWPVVVGVVKDVPHRGVEDRSGIPYIYQVLGGQQGTLAIFLRTERNLAALVPLVREKLRAIDPAIALYESGPLATVIDESFTQRRATMLLIGAFAGLALFLSALGIYGVLAYDVTQRTRELGVRGAIGATPPQIVALVMRQGLWKTTVGIVLGLVGAALLSRYLGTLLFQVEPTDPRAYAAVALIFLLVAALASYLPARRAARINPVEALQTE